VQLTIMIDTQQQYIKLNIHSEISIMVVQAHSGRKRDTCIYAHTPTHTYSHIIYIYMYFNVCVLGYLILSYFANTIASCFFMMSNSERN
jgi:hypothetical protein